MNTVKNKIKEILSPSKNVKTQEKYSKTTRKILYKLYNKLSERIKLNLQFIFSLIFDLRFASLDIFVYLKKRLTFHIFIVQLAINFP